MKLATHLACALLGFLLAWWILRDVPVVEPYAPAVTLPSGAVVAERVPDAPLPPVAREAARELGGTIARAGSVTVQPRTPDAAPSETPAAGSAVPAASCLCKPAPVRFDWSLIGLDDGTYRMAVDSPDGTITSATDIPVSGVSVRRERPWAAGVSYSMDMSQRRAAGLWVDRDVGRVRLGLEISQRDGGTATLRAGIRF